MNFPESPVIDLAKNISFILNTSPVRKDPSFPSQLCAIQHIIEEFSISLSIYCNFDRNRQRDTRTVFYEFYNQFLSTMADRIYPFCLDSQIKFVDGHRAKFASYRNGNIQ
jgi:hypothetical protein